jgi:DNA-binding MarR family transcriptional regulator
MCSGGAIMHPVSFQMKRAHLSCLRLCRGILREVCAEDDDRDGRQPDAEDRRGDAEDRKRDGPRDHELHAREDDGDDGDVDADAHAYTRDDADDMLPLVTPARFDVLTAIYGWGYPYQRMRRVVPYGAEQFEIRQKLGLHSSTISKMIARMIELRLLTRRRADGGDRRRSVVEMTPFGVRIYRKALQVVMGGRQLTESFERFVWGTRSPPRSRKRHEFHYKMELLFDHTWDLAQHFGDRTQTPYSLRQANRSQHFKDPWEKPKGFSIWSLLPALQKSITPPKGQRPCMRHGFPLVKPLPPHVPYVRPRMNFSPTRDWYSLWLAGADLAS